MRTSRGRRCAIAGIALFSLILHSPLGAQIPKGYSPKGDGKMRYGFATEGDYSLIGPDGATYRAVVVHPEKDIASSAWYFEGADGKALKKASVAASLYKAATLAHLNRKGTLLGEMKEARELLRSALVGIGAYNVGKFVKEVGSKAEGVIVRLALTGGGGAVAPAAAKRAISKELLKGMSKEDFVAKGTIQLAATMKSLYAAYATASILDAEDKLGKAIDVAEAVKGPWKADTGETVYDAWRYAAVEGLPAIVLWNEMCDTGGLFGAIKTIFADFFEGATEIKIGLAFDLMETYEASNDDFFVKANGKYESLRSTFRESFLFFEKEVKRLGGRVAEDYDPLAWLLPWAPVSVFGVRGPVETLFLDQFGDSPASVVMEVSPRGLVTRRRNVRNVSGIGADTLTFSYDSSGMISSARLADEDGEPLFDIQVEGSAREYTATAYSYEYRGHVESVTVKVDERGRITSLDEEIGLFERRYRKKGFEFKVGYGEDEITVDWLCRPIDLADHMHHLQVIPDQIGPMVGVADHIVSEMAGNVVYKLGFHFVEKIRLGEAGLPVSRSLYTESGDLAQKLEYAYDELGYLVSETAAIGASVEELAFEYDSGHDEHENWNEQLTWMKTMKFGEPSEKLLISHSRSADYYRAEPPQVPSAARSAPSGAAPIYGAVFNLDGPSDHLNVRDSPSTGGSILAKLDDGAKVTILGKTKGADPWYKVEVGGITGWCNAAYLRLAPGDADRMPMAE